LGTRFEVELKSNRPASNKVKITTSRKAFQEVERSGGLYDSGARTMAGIILIAVPTIQSGGYFLLTSR
jgi:hypothetical protein